GGGVEPRRGYHDPAGARGGRERCALGEQRADEPSAPRAEAAPDRQLTASRGGAREQEIGRVGAGDQQHQGDGTRQYKEALADVADRRLPEQLDIEAAAEARSPAGGGCRSATA